MPIEAPQIGGRDPVTPSQSPSDSSEYWRYVQIAEGIRAGCTESMAELYRMLTNSARYFFLARIRNQEVGDRIHETFKLVVLAIQRGQLRDPERLMGFVHTVLKRQIAVAIGQAVIGRKADCLDGCFQVRSTALDPEQTAASRERLKIVADTMAKLPEKQRTVLIEFYLKEKPANQICREMNLTETQFRLLKSRAKKHFGSVGRRRVMRGRLQAI